VSGVDLTSVTIVSGGQTGADRAALDFAIQHGIPHGGWCPRGRLAEDGPLEEIYQLTETPSRNYAVRTDWNVRDSDATLALSIDPEVSGGTALTIDLTDRHGRPCLHLARDAGQSADELAAELLEFLAVHRVERLNIAGPRASQEPEVAAFVHDLLTKALALSSDSS